LDGATVVGCDHELNRVVLWDGDVSGVVNHEQVVAALLEWFAVKVAVDVVLHLVAARLILDIGTNRWCFVDGVADSEKTGQSVSVCC
jgi:hypothetical protein